MTTHRNSLTSHVFSARAWGLVVVSLVTVSLVTPASGQSTEVPTGTATNVPFEKLVLTDKYYCDGIQTGDINRDGHADVVAGPLWYAGPTFSESHAFYDVVPLAPEASPSDSMYSFVYDFNNDSWPDILVLGRVHLHPAYWYENPKDAQAVAQALCVRTRAR